ncbi:potassium channel family protein [Roseateles koreensis]|uniref:Potassium channel family protein n=1 Tax=Roseateles koreensis TaxID=2987526 RepID=A0ABT5KVN5_9BURK|nr:potassium channel family protein [Roseateles koreensis]MDC8786505.1 potassium channel family protein [Roseateles koreensis]
MPHRISTRSWGLARPSPLNATAARAERYWRWPVLMVLFATIPAFYIELLENLPTPLALAIYLVAAGVTALSLWRVARHVSHPRQYLRSNALDVLLVVGLLVAALLPPSALSNQALAARLFVALLTLLRMVWAIKSWVTRGGLGYLLSLALLVLGFCGVGFWALEPRVHSLGDGLWLAFTTAATVGYGDIVPTTPAAKIFAVFVVLLGYAVLSLVTAAIASFWVESSERRMERDILRDMHAQLRGLHEEVAALKDELRHK